MPRTCESIARVKIEHKQRTKRCNLQHFALSDGKNLRKYHSFSPRKWIKHSYLQGFARVTIRFFEKHVNATVFFIHQGKKSVQKVQTISNLQLIYSGLVLSRAKNCVNTSVSACNSGQNTAIYSNSCLPRFLDIPKIV